jgi:hypothetical protein
MYTASCKKAVARLSFIRNLITRVSGCDTARQKKPRIEKSNPGMSLFYPPILMDAASVREA